jgi:hypothetical protein
MRSMSRRGVFAVPATFFVAAILWGSPVASADPGKNPDKGNGKPTTTTTTTTTTTSAPRAAVRSGTGIVQTVLAHVVVVRQLDGTLVRVKVGPKTIVFVNRVRAHLDDVEPGFVVRYSGISGKGVAAVLRATDPLAGRQAGSAVAGKASADKPSSGNSMTAREVRGRSSG